MVKKCKKKPKTKTTVNYKNCSNAFITVHKCRTTQHATVLIIFPLNLETITIAQTASLHGKRNKRA